MRLRPRDFVLVVAAALGGVVLATQPDKPVESADPWDSLRYFEGHWTGQGEGRWGTSTIDRTYEFFLNDSYLHARNRSVYPPQEKNAKGEEHEDWSFFSRDKSRDTFIMREFNNEAITNTYVLEAGPDGDTALVFTTENVENFMPGWRARLKYRIVDRDEFVEIFELAPPDKDFTTFVTNRLNRVR